MKKLVLLSLLIPAAVQPYVIQNNSGRSLYAAIGPYRTSYNGLEPSDRLTFEYYGFLGSGHLNRNHIIRHIIDTHSWPGHEQRTEKIYIGLKSPENRHFVRDDLNVIDLNSYSDEQLTRDENPVTFTINPDFTITASEEGTRIPPAPPAPFPFPNLPALTISAPAADRAETKSSSAASQEPATHAASNSVSNELALLANQLTTLVRQIK